MHIAPQSGLVAGDAVGEACAVDVGNDKVRRPCFLVEAWIAFVQVAWDVA